MRSYKTENRIIEDHGDWVELDISTEKFKDSVMYIDKVDLRSLQDIGCGRISACRTNANGCVYSQTRIATGYGDYRIVSVHRMITGEPPYVDHKDHNGLNNRRNNLRSCTHSENLQNRRKKRGKSLYKGVSPLRDKFIARIRVDGESIYLGSFCREIDAHMAYCNAANRYFKNFACFD